MRLIDLHIPWLRQYEGACTTLLGIEHDPGPIRRRLGQIEAYLQDTAAAIIPCGRHYGSIGPGPARWSALGAAFARIEAEFPGRILADPADFARWREDAQGMAWALPGLPGLDLFARDDSDRERLRSFYVRGLRVVRLHSGESQESVPDLAPTLEFLASLHSGEKGSRPALDLAGAPMAQVDAALDWFEADPARASRLIPCALGILPEQPEQSAPDAWPAARLARLRALSGMIGLAATSPHLATPDHLRRSLDAIAEHPFDGRPGLEGIGIATRYLDDDPPPDRRTVAALLKFLSQSLSPTDATTLAQWNPRQFLARL